MFLAFLVGCASTHSPKVRQAAHQYQSVDRSMSREDVYHILEQPQSRLANGCEQWLVLDGRQRAQLLLRFGADGNMTSMQRNIHWRQSD